MYKHTTNSYKDLTADIRNYIDHVNREAASLECVEDRMEVADNNRQLHHHVKMFRNHADRDDFNTALILLSICRTRLYKYVAHALHADVNFNLSHAAFLLNSIEEYAHTMQVKINAAK